MFKRNSSKLISSDARRKKTVIVAYVLRGFNCDGDTIHYLVSETDEILD